MIICNACKSAEVKKLGVLKAYIDYETLVYRCIHCKSHFVKRTASIHEELHKVEGSTYSSHTDLALKISRFFAAGKVNKIREILSEAAANKFIIKSINKFKNDIKILEFGCSKGCLGAYFLASGNNYTGLDISKTAIKEATSYFGNHFMLSDAPQIKENGNYDVIFHVGTIGCVEDPVAFINYNLSLLSKGGTLLFNAPNARSCEIFSDIWVTQTFPPDLITLFPVAFWHTQFSDQADVRVQIASERPAAILRKIMLKLTKGTTISPPTRHLFPNNNLDQQTQNAQSRNKLSIAAKKVLIWSLGSALKKFIPAEFGTHIRMIKK